MPDFRFWFLDENGQRNVTFIVTGQDRATVGSVAADLAVQMRRLPMVANVVSTATLNRPELQIHPRRDLAVRLGYRPRACPKPSGWRPSAMSRPALAQFDAGDRIVPIRVLLEEHARADRQVLEQLRVPSPRGVLVPLVGACRLQLRRRPHQHRSTRPAAAGQRRRPISSPAKRSAMPPRRSRRFR